MGQKKLRKQPATVVLLKNQELNTSARITFWHLTTKKKHPIDGDNDKDQFGGSAVLWVDDVHDEPLGIDHGNDVGADVSDDHLKSAGDNRAHDDADVAEESVAGLIVISFNYLRVQIIRKRR